MIELLVAITVISTGLFAAATMVFSNLQLADRDADEVIAINLAREGIEEAKELRDSNWLAGNPFDQGLSENGNDYTAVPVWAGDAGMSAISFNFAPSTIADPLSQVGQSNASDTFGFYTQADPSAPRTPWRRLLIFHPICDTAGGLVIVDDGQDCGLDPKMGIRVEAHIQWQRKGQMFNRTLYEDLFDWR